MEEQKRFKIPKDFTVDGQFNKYLKLVNLDPRKMNPTELKERRQMFYGATGQLIVLMRDDLTKLAEGNAEIVLQEMLNEVSDYFLPKN